MAFNCTSEFLSTKWVDYVEEPMKYQALRPQFFSVGGWGVGGGGVGVVVWVVVGDGRLGGDGVGWVVVGVQSGGGVVGLDYLSNQIKILKNGGVGGVHRGG